jgi:hypothetical protein
MRIPGPVATQAVRYPFASIEGSAATMRRLEAGSPAGQLFQLRAEDFLAASAVAVAGGPGAAE